DEHHFPENVKENEIERHEDAEHAGLEQQKQDVVFLFALLNCGPRREDGNCAEDCGEHDQQEAEAVYAERVASADGRDPFVVGEKLESRRVESRVEAPDERQRDEQAEAGEDIATPAGKGGGPGG